MGAPKGNRYNRKYSDDEIEAIFIEVYENAANDQDDEILCLEDAIATVDMPFSTYDYWARRGLEGKDLGAIKKDTQRVILRKINRKALKNNFNTAASIWRLKQLGEFEVVHNENNNYNQDINVKVNDGDDDD